MCRFESGHPHHFRSSPPYIPSKKTYDGDMMNSIKIILSNSCVVFFGLAIIAAMSLGAGFIAQYQFGLQPCILCLYQRWPFAVVILLCAVGIWMGGRHKMAAPIFMGLISLTFFTNAIIAFYHTGVERHWWKSFLEGCAVPDMTGDITEVLARIAQTPAVRCDEIPWVDPIIGLSMANYNVALCLGLGVLSLISAVLIRRRA